MSDKENYSIERDAIPTTSSSSSRSLEVYNDLNGIIANTESHVVNNSNSLTVNHLNNNVTNFRIEHASNLTFGHTYNINGGSARNKRIGKSLTSEEENDVYRKTKNIKKMMQSDQPLNEKYLDIFCEHFGSFWLSVATLLKIDELFVQRMYEDHFNRGGTQEVSRLLDYKIKPKNIFYPSGYLSSFI